MGTRKEGKREEVLQIEVLRWMGSEDNTYYYYYKSSALL